MKILLTGGLGLIGYRLLESLKYDFEITVIDIRDPKGYELDNINVIRKDINEIKKSDLNTQYDGFIHLAGVSRVIDGEKYPLKTWNTNVDATNRILNLLKDENGHPWVIYGSSREVYGEPKSVPVCESAPLVPINRYGLSKFCAESLIGNYCVTNKSSSIIFRFSNVYGSLNDHHDRVIPLFISKALKNQTLQLHGAENTFDFTFIDDTVNGITKAINLLSSNDKTINKILNLTTGKGTSLLSLAELIIDICESNSEFVNTNERSYDVNHFIGSYERAENILGYKPEISLVNGIKKYVELINYSRPNLIH